LRLALALLVLACLALPLRPAVAQNRTPTPSAEELWDTYPLHPRATPTPVTAVRTSAPQPAERSVPHTGSSVPGVLLGLLGVVLALVALALPERRRRRSAAAPPDPQRSWTATIEWREAGEQARFCVCARGERGDAATELTSSAPLEWPPDGPAAVLALTEATDRLEAALLAAGWKPLPPGREWYAKRFAWQPAPQPAVRRAPWMEARRAR
jgi:hypothetical protein